MENRYDTLSAGRGRIHFRWSQRADGKWVRVEMWGRTSRSGREVEKNLDHLITRAFDSEADCRRALQRAAKAWLYQHS